MVFSRNSLRGMVAGLSLLPITMESRVELVFRASANASPPAWPSSFPEASSYVPQENRKATLKLEQEEQMKSIAKRGLTEVMVLFLAIEAARAFAPSGPRPLEEASSYLPQERQGEGERQVSKNR